MASDTTVRVHIRMAGAPASEPATKVSMPNPLINKCAKDLLAEVNRVLAAAGRPPVVQLRGPFGAVIPADTFAYTLNGKVLEVATAVQVKAGVTTKLPPAPLTHRSLVHQGGLGKDVGGGSSPSSRGKPTSSLMGVGNRRSRDSAAAIESRLEGKVPMKAPSKTALQISPHEDLQPRDPYMRIVEANALRYISPRSHNTMEAIFNAAPSEARVHLFAQPRSASPLLTTPSAQNILDEARDSLRPQLEACAEEVRGQFRAEEHDTQAVLDREENMRRVWEHQAAHQHHGSSPTGVARRDYPATHRNVKWHAPASHLDPRMLSQGTKPPSNTSSSSPTRRGSVATDPLAFKRRQFAEEWRQGYAAKMKEKADREAYEQSEEAQQERIRVEEERQQRQREEAARAAQIQAMELQMARERITEEEAERANRRSLCAEEENCFGAILGAHEETVAAYIRFVNRRRTQRIEVEESALHARGNVLEDEDIAFAELLNKEGNQRFQLAETLRQQRVLEGIHKASRDGLFVDCLQCHDEVMEEREQGLVRLGKLMAEAEAVIRIRAERLDASQSAFSEDPDERVSSPLRESRSFSPLPAAVRRRQQEEAERKQREEDERQRRQEQTLRSSCVAEEEDALGSSVMMSPASPVNKSKAEYYDEF